MQLDESPLRVWVCTELETDWAAAQWKRITASWGGSRVGGGSLSVENADAADAVLISLTDPKDTYDSSVRRIRKLPVWRSHRDAVFVFDTSDRPHGLFPGLYASLRRRLFSRARHRTCCYVQSFNECVDLRPWTPRPRLLASFQGNLTSPPRARLFGLPPRPEVVIERTEPFWACIGDDRMRPFKQRYADLIGQSRFVLCPRGNGTSSFRLFETLQSGRVPVVIADSWVPPDGIDWSTCSLRVAERDVDRVFEICEAADAGWLEMAREGRRVWEQWFSPAGLSHSVARAIRSIWRTRHLPERAYVLEWPVRSGVMGARGVLVRCKVAMLNVRDAWTRSGATASR